MLENKEKIYTKQEVIKATLEYFKGDVLAADVWAKKYCLKDDKNYYELTPDDMHRRIAKELARIELKYPHPLTEEEIYQTLKDFKRIIPQGSPMAGIGNNFQVVSLSNCFVIGNIGGASAIASKFTGDPGEQILSYSKEGIVRIWYDKNAKDNSVAKARYTNPAYKLNQKQTGNGYNLFNLGGI